MNKPNVNHMTWLAAFILGLLLMFQKNIGGVILCAAIMITTRINDLSRELKKGK